MYLLGLKNGKKYVLDKTSFNPLFEKNPTEDEIQWKNKDNRSVTTFVFYYNGPNESNLKNKENYNERKVLNIISCLFLDRSPEISQWHIRADISYEWIYPKLIEAILGLSFEPILNVKEELKISYNKNGVSVLLTKNDKQIALEKLNQLEKGLREEIPSYFDKTYMKYVKEDNVANFNLLKEALR